MKKSTKISLTLLAAFIVAVGVIVVNVMRNNSVVGGLTININYGDQPKLITESEVESLLLASYPGLTSQRIKDVHTKAIVDTLSQNCYLTNIRSAVSVGGRIVVNATQKRPIVRAYYGDKVFYIDDQGQCFPISKNAECDVIVANGNFHQKLSGKIQKLNIAELANDSIRSKYDIVNVWKLACFLDKKSTQYNVLYDQIYIDTNSDLILQPRVGSHEILVGSADNLERKFNNLKKFYANGMPHAGYNSYSRVSIKFDNQVVCTKRKNN